MRGYKEKLFSCCWGKGKELGESALCAYEGPIVRIFEVKTQKVTKVINLLNPE